MSKNGPETDSSTVVMAEAVEEVAQLLREGKSVSREDLQRRYAHLMPELANVVRELQTFIGAEKEIAAEVDDCESGIELRKMTEALSTALPGYRIQEVIHSGGQGTVFKAYQQSMHRHVAIKVMHDSPLANVRRSSRFAREIRVVSQLQLPNIVQIHESGIAQKHPYFIMQFIEGVPVDDYALANQLSVQARLELLAKIVRAVSRAHQRGIIHRDLKPSNILIDLEGEPHILDFGLAKALRNATEGVGSDHVSMVGHVIGTLPYLSPEQASGFDEVDVRSDVYALGIILFELLTGTYPFNVFGEKADARAQIIRGEPKGLRESASTGEWTGFPAVQELDDDLQAIVSMALAKAKSERYQSAEALADDLSRYLAGDIVQARIDQRWYITWRIMRKYRVQLASAAAVFVSLAVATVVSTSLWFEARRERDSARKIATLAQDTLDHVVTEVDEQIESLAGGKIVRQHLLNGVANRLEELRTLVTEDEALAGIAISLQERQGDIAWSEGRIEDARELYLRSAEALAQGGDNEATIALARLHRKAGRCFENGKVHFDQSIRFARKANKHSIAGAELELSRALLGAAENSYLTGEHTQAAQYVDEALEILRAFGDGQKILADALERDGDVRIKLGELGRSCDSFQEAIQIREELLAERPYDVRLRYSHMNASTKLGTALGMTGRRTEALKHARGAHADSAYLLETSGKNPDYRRIYLSTATRLAIILRQMNNYAEALNVVAPAIQRARGFLDEGNQELRVRHQLGFALEERGRIHKLSGSYAEAVNDAQAALTIRKLLADEHPSNLDYAHELALSHDSLGSCLQRVARHAEALEHLVTSCQIHRQLVERQPDVPDRLLNLVQSSINLAAWHMRLKSDEGNKNAEQVLSDARIHLAGLEERTPQISESKEFEACQDAVAVNLAILEKRKDRPD